MGVVISKASRKLKRFNVENRAHRVLDQDKPTPAPKFQSNLKDMERALELDPQFVEKLNRKDASLDDRLKNVYVTSKDSFIDYGKQRQSTDADRPLPLDRSIPEDFEYGWREPQRVTPGRCTLRQAMKFITDHQGDPDLWTKQRIAEDYKLKEDVVDKILQHFRSFNVHIPDTRKNDNILTQAKAKLLKDGKDENKST